MYEPEFGEDVSEETFNQTKAYDGSDFYDKVIQIKDTTTNSDDDKLLLNHSDYVNKEQPR